MASFPDQTSHHCFLSPQVVGKSRTSFGLMTRGIYSGFHLSGGLPPPQSVWYIFDTHYAPCWQWFILTYWLVAPHCNQPKPKWPEPSLIHIHAGHAGHTQWQVQEKVVHSKQKIYSNHLCFKGRGSLGYIYVQYITYNIIYVIWYVCIYNMIYIYII